MSDPRAELSMPPLDVQISIPSALSLMDQNRSAREQRDFVKTLQFPP